MKKNISIKGCVSAVVVILVLLVASSVLKSLKKKPVQSRPPVPVVSVVVEAKDVPLYVNAIGRCVASEEVNIIPQVSGQIIEVKFTQGQAVKAGDPLYTIDPRTYEANLQKAEAQLATAKAKMKVDLAQFERSKALVPQNYISQQQYETYEAQVTQDAASVEAAQAQVAQAKLDLEHCNIVSPIDGITGAYLIDVGNVIEAMSTNNPLVTIENVDKLFIEFTVSENNFYDLQKFFKENENKLKVEVLPISGREASGVAYIEFIDNSINDKTGSMKLRAFLDNTDHKFWPGQSIRAKIILTELKGAVVVPSEAVKLGQIGRYVFVVKDDKSAELRMVEIGQVHDEILVIRDGLSAGEVIVQRGQLMLAPGMKVVEVPDDNVGIYQQGIEQNSKTSEKNPTK